jgi:CBS domain containing-hemolysin-like protein
MDKVKNQKIQKQVERWDLFARLTPTLFLATSLILVVFDVVPLEYAFYIGLTGFVITAVSWWWWAIFTIRYLISILSRASTNLIDVNNEIKIVKKELEDLKDER